MAPRRSSRARRPAECPDRFGRVRRGVAQPHGNSWKFMEMMVRGRPSWSWYHELLQVMVGVAMVRVWLLPAPFTLKQPRARRPRQGGFVVVWRSWSEDATAGRCSPRQCIIYFWKVIVWDKVSGLRTTDPITGMIADWTGMIVIAYVGDRSIEKVARIFRGDLAMSKVQRRVRLAGRRGQVRHRSLTEILARAA
jgi:hypothetical protein